MAADLLERVRAAGLAAGADAVGVTSARRFDTARSVIEERKAEGLHAGMHFTYGRPERSTDPARLMDGAQSIVVALRRYPAADRTSDAQGVAAVGRYVERDEYGQLASALESMAEELRRSGNQAVPVMDDNRMVDRAAAARAGLGWFGRNTMLLHPRLGSWTVIGSVVTDAPLPARDVVMDDGCGSCRRCQVECPTGALDRSGVLDANRCLAWLLQDTGPFPVEHRVALGQRLYGCDDCQEVCPVNDEMGATAVRVGAPERARVQVLDLLETDDRELLDGLGHWYIPRRQPEYLRRNALVVLGNMPGLAIAEPDRVRSVLNQSLGSASAIVRSHAVWAARRLGLDELVRTATAQAGFFDDDDLVADELRREMS